MNGMEQKVAERSAALECNGEKRKPPAAGFGRKIIHGLHRRQEVGSFCGLYWLMEYRVGWCELADLLFVDYAFNKFS